MIKHEDRLAHGWFLKQSKLRKAWLVDPFTLHKENGELVAHRTNKRMLLLTESSYIFENLKLSDVPTFSLSLSLSLSFSLPPSLQMSNATISFMAYVTGKREKKNVSGLNIHNLHSNKKKDKF
jgi:hypothetical protein